MTAVILYASAPAHTPLGVQALKCSLKSRMAPFLNAAQLRRPAHALLRARQVQLPSPATCPTFKVFRSQGGPIVMETFSSNALSVQLQSDWCPHVCLMPLGCVMGGALCSCLANLRNERCSFHDFTICNEDGVRLVAMRLTRLGLLWAVW
eukprot:2758385-Amphidinium_carterae.3